MLLRHPVVLTSLEEDFQKLGLLKEADGSEVSTGSADSQDEEDDLDLQGKPEEDLEHADDDLDEDELAALAEAEAFAEAFDSEYGALGHEAEFRIDLNDMEDLEGCGEAVMLPYGVIESERDEAPLDEVEEEEDEVDEARMRIHRMSSAERAKERMRKRSAHSKMVTKRREGKASVKRRRAKSRAKSQRMGGARKGYRMEFDSLDALRNSLESLSNDTALESTEYAIPAFANVALIAEKLYDAFKAAGDDALAEGYAELAKHAAGVVEFLESDDEVDEEALEAQFEEFLAVLEPGVEAFDVMAEDEDEEFEGLEDEKDFEEDEEEDENAKKSEGEREQE